MNGSPILSEPGRRSTTGEIDPRCKEDKCTVLINSLINRRQTEKRINSFPNYTVPIPDQAGQLYNVHFVALFSENPEAIPIVMLHGWPGIIIILSPNYHLAFMKLTLIRKLP
jgi:Epoxide hydrolase N terminus